ncbi:MAG: HD domain-containing protein [Oscillospiraceae bacterium]|nr:HD domain-containing protein [Oscillospiraceae bacterium]
MVKILSETIAVSKLSELFALELGFLHDDARQIGIAAALHDVGKLWIPNCVLNKPGKLSFADFEIVKTHTKIGAQILLDVPGELGEMARITCEFHHEWHDGNGYWGIPTSELPDYVPIVSISDVFVACCAKRSYKDPWPPEQVLEHLQTLSDKQFSKALVDEFIRFIKENKDVAAIFAI